MTLIRDIEPYYTLQVREWVAAVLVDEDLEALTPNIVLRHQYQLEWLARQLSLSLRVPCKVLQDDRVIAEWPRGLWDYIKRAVGLKYSKKQLRLNECVVYPNVALPDLGRLSQNIRLAVEPRITDIPHPYPVE